MIKRQSQFLLTLIVFFLSPISSAYVSDESIDKLLDLSGLTNQVGQFPGLIKTGVEQAKQQGSPITDGEYSVIVNSIDKSILASEIIEGIRTAVKSSIGEKELQQLLVWYESDLGKEITLAEENASTPQAYQQMMQSAQSLLQNTERVEFANRLDMLLGATDMTMDLQRSTGIAVYSAVMTVMQPDTPVNIDAFEAQMDAASEQTRAAIKQVVNISYVYSYQDIEVTKLKKYESFLNDGTTQKFNKTIMESMSKGLESSISNFANELANELKKVNKNES